MSVAAQSNETILEAFYWEMNTGEYASRHPEERDLWKLIAQRAEYLKRIGFTTLILPPANKCLGGALDVGYANYDLWDLGEFDQRGSIRTKYGTKAEFAQCMQALHEQGIRVYCDAVLNHRMGGDQEEEVSTDTGGMQKVWTKFTFPGRQGQYSDFKWDSSCFSGMRLDNDSDGKVVLMNGAQWSPTIGMHYLMGFDVNYNRQDVKEDVLRWANWMVDSFAIDGFRLDALKHLSIPFIQEFVGNLRLHHPDLTFLGEAWYNDAGQFIEGIQPLGDLKVHFFDFPLRAKLLELGNHDFSLAGLGREGLANNPDFQSRSVTFVENHDTGRDDLQDGVHSCIHYKCEAYAYILCRAQGLPTVLWKDFISADLHDKLEKLIQARSHAAYGEGVESNVSDHDTYVYLRRGDAEHPGSGLVLLITRSNNGTKIIKSVQTDMPHTEFHDMLGHIADRVHTDENGRGDFAVQAMEGSGFSVWVRD